MTIRDAFPDYRQNPALGPLRVRLYSCFSRLFTNDQNLSDAELLQLRRQLKDYARAGVKTYTQRQISYLGLCGLVGLFYEPTFALICYILLQIAENLEFHLSVKVRRWSGRDAKTALRLQQLLMVAALFSSSIVGLMALGLARQEGATTHFVPLMLLFTSALTGAVNNRQMPSILFGRLMNYGFVFLLIPIIDIWEAKPGFDSALWMQLITVVFALYIVITYSLVYLKLYRHSMYQLEDLKQERDRAKVASAAKSQFVSVVSHELRTPLTSILGSLDLLSNGVFDQQPDQAKRILEIAHNNSKQLSNLINDLLDLQRIDSGHIVCQIAPTNLIELVEKSVVSIGVYAGTSGINLEFTSSENEIIAPVDSDRILQVMANLLSNAIKFSKVGGSVQVSLTKSEENVIISVKDFGIGIPENSHDLVFGKFSQIDSSDHRAFGGSGLGMSITKEIIEMHKGTVDFVSELGEGTEFIVTLPRFTGRDLATQPKPE